MSAPPLSTPAVRDESSELAPETVEMVRRGLVIGLVGVVGVAFTVSWTALHDIGRAIGLDFLGATLYPLAADGPIALALVASLVLGGRHRRAALVVLGLYTCASLALNYVHGLVPLEGTRPRLSPVDWVHYALVGVASALPVGSIFFGADLVTRVLRRARPADAVEAEPEVEPQVEPVDTPVDTPRRRRWGRKAEEPLVLQPQPEPQSEPEFEPVLARPLEVICGATEAYWPQVPAGLAPPVEPQPETQPEPASPVDPHEVIARCWWEGELSTRGTADLVGLSKSAVDKVWQRLAAEHGQRPAPGQSVPGPGQLAMSGVAA